MDSRYVAFQMRGGAWRAVWQVKNKIKGRVLWLDSGPTAKGKTAGEAVEMLAKMQDDMLSELAS